MSGVARLRLAMRVVVACAFGPACKTTPTTANAPEPQGAVAPSASGSPSLVVAKPAPAADAGTGSTASAITDSAPMPRDPDCGPVPAYFVKPGKPAPNLVIPDFSKESGPITLAWRKRQRKHIPEAPIPGKKAVVAEHDLHAVELLVSRGKQVLRIEIGAETGYFDPRSHRFCDSNSTGHEVTPNADLELSRLSFSMGGEAGFVVRLLRRGVLQLVHFTGADGKCSDLSIERTEVRQIAVPPDATFVEALRVEFDEGPPREMTQPCAP